MERREILNKFPPVKDNLLLILHELQRINPGHCISADDMRDVADYLNISLSSVYGVATYYSMFSLKPRGRYIISVCRSPVCDMMGCEGILDALFEELGIGPGETSPDGMFTIETSECLGRCDESPAILINEQLFGRLNRKKLLEIVKSLRSGKE